MLLIADVKPVLRTFSISDFVTGCFFLILLPGGSGVLAEQASATRDNESHCYVHGGAYVHFDNNDDYSGVPLFGGVEYHRPDDWFGGLSLFNNSYGQFSQYLYLGKTFHPWDSHPEVRVKFSAGVAHGYRGDHRDTLPIHRGGSWGLGFVPAIGYQKAVWVTTWSFSKRPVSSFLSATSSSRPLVVSSHLQPPKTACELKEANSVGQST